VTPLERAAILFATIPTDEALEALAKAAIDFAASVHPEVRASVTRASVLPAPTERGERIAPVYLASAAGSVELQAGDGMIRSHAYRAERG
jgi:hypothetical protein